MITINRGQLSAIGKPEILFCIGWVLVNLSLFSQLGMPWETFIHSWRLDLFSALFVASCLIFLLNSRKSVSAARVLSRDELRLLVLPLCTFILWSSFSMVWARSWKSAFHHTMVWSVYLAFYLIIRGIVNSDSNFRKILSSAVAPFLLLGVTAAIVYCSAIIFAEPNSFGVRGKFAKYGEPVVAILPLVIAAVMTLGRRQFKYGVLSVCALWLLVFCSLGRINILLFVLGFAMSVLIAWRQGNWQVQKLRFAILAAALLAVLIPIHLTMAFSPGSDVPIVSRLSDSAGNSGSNNVRVLMTLISLEMVKSHPVTGIGADNFGIDVSRYRAQYASANSSDPNLALAEDEITARTHNEFLQVVAELGLVGGALFGWMLAGIAVMFFRLLRSKEEVPQYAFAAFAGISLFLISSLVSSFSFRLIQNGFIFFFVLAVASKYAAPQGGLNVRGPVISPRVLRSACAAGILACFGLMGYSAVRLASAVVTARANSTADIEAASRLYRTAMMVDDENPDARNNFGMRLFDEKRYDESADLLEQSMDLGRVTSTDFSYLASARSLSGNSCAAEKTMAKAAAIYPHSPFILSRFASLLVNNEKSAEAAEVFDHAVAVDTRAALTWRALIDRGPKAASDLAAVNRDYVPVMELLPQLAIYAAVTERLINHPEERRFSSFPVPE